VGLATHDDGWRISDALWARIAKLLPSRKKHPLGCHRPRVPDRSAMNAILFVLRTGCQWHALDATGICSCSSAYRRFREWGNAGLFLDLWIDGLMEYDARKGLDWAWLSMDGSMTKAPLGGEATGPNPTDRGKRGTKRSVLTEANGIIVGLAVDGANRNDFKMMRETILGIPITRPEPVTWRTEQGMCLDKGYDYEEARALLREFRFTAHIRCRGEEAKALKKEAGEKARRWVVERAHSWLNRFRRLLVRWEKRADTYMAMLHVSLGIITLRLSGSLEAA
jgi:putative transposase